MYNLGVFSRAWNNVDNWQRLRLAKGGMSRSFEETPVPISSSQCRRRRGSIHILLCLHHWRRTSSVDIGRWWTTKTQFGRAKADGFLIKQSQIALTGTCDGTGNATIFRRPNVARPRYSPQRCCPLPSWTFCIWYICKFCGPPRYTATWTRYDAPVTIAFRNSPAPPEVHLYHQLYGRQHSLMIGSTVDGTQRSCCSTC